MSRWIINIYLTFKHLIQKALKVSKHSKFKERLSQKRNKKWENLKEKNLVRLENILHAEGTTSKNFVKATLKTVKERNSEEKNQVL